MQVFKSCLFILCFQSMLGGVLFACLFLFVCFVNLKPARFIWEEGMEIEVIAFRGLACKPVGWHFMANN